jgi:hypothetical protein
MIAVAAIIMAALLLALFKRFGWLALLAAAGLAAYRLLRPIRPR